VYNSQTKPNLRCKRKVLSGSEGLLEMVGLEVTAEGVRAGTHSGSWRDFRTVGAVTLKASQLLCDE